jgi:hypothetical protein
LGFGLWSLVFGLWALDCVFRTLFFELCTLESLSRTLTVGIDKPRTKLKAQSSKLKEQRPKPKDPSYK